MFYIICLTAYFYTAQHTLSHCIKTEPRGHSFAAPALSLNRLDESTAVRSFLFYPLIPLDAIPCTKNFCPPRKIASTGIKDSTLAAMTSPYSAEYWAMNILMPS